MIRTPELFPSLLSLVPYMHSPAPNVLGIFPEPDRELSVNVIARCLLRIHANHDELTWKKLAKRLDVHPDTLASAVKGASLLGFDVIARIGYHFPDEFELVETLWLASVRPPVTTADRIDAMQRRFRAPRLQRARAGQGKPGQERPAHCRGRMARGHAPRQHGPAQGHRARAPGHRYAA